LLPVERQIFTVAAHRFFGCDLEGEDGAIHFAAGALDWFARLQGDCARKLFFTLVDTVGNSPQNPLTLEGGSRRVVPKAFTEAAITASACSRRP